MYHREEGEESPVKGRGSYLRCRLMRLVYQDCNVCFPSVYQLLLEISFDSLH